MRISAAFLCVFTSAALLSGASTAWGIGPGCDQDSDCDGIPDTIEAAVGGSGIDLVPGTVATSATQSPGGEIQIDLASAGLAGSSRVTLPSGTTAGATPITLEFAVEPSSTGAFVIVNGATHPAAVTKTIAIPSGSLSIVAIADVPGASRYSLLSTPRSSRFQLPPCPCPSSTSTNLDGAATAYTVTHQGDGSVSVSGLLHSAVGMTNTVTPVPGATPSGWVALMAAIMIAGGFTLRRTRTRGGS